MIQPTLPRLTSIRFFAAAIVLLYHFGAGFSREISAPATISQFLSNGNLGVSFFFILSGFILAYAHCNDELNANNVIRFYVQRLARIYPVYIFSLGLALPYRAKTLEFEQIISVLTMTQAWTPPISQLGYLWIIQAWTVSVEMMFYFCFPFMWYVLRRCSLPGAITTIIVCVSIMLILGTAIIAPGIQEIPLLGANTSIIIPVLRLPEFVYGMALCLLFLKHKPLLRYVSGTWVELSLVLLIVIIMSTAKAPQLKSLIAVLSGILILSVAFGTGALSRFLSESWLVYLGATSYALYILQGPVRVWCAELLQSPYDRASSPLFTLLLAMVSFHLIERPARRFILSICRVERSSVAS